MNPTHAAVLQLPDRPDKAALLAAFADYCQFPDYFGHNWDALNDCLADWILAQDRPLCLTLAGDTAPWNGNADWHSCLDILNSLVETCPGFSWQLQAPASLPTEADPA